MRSIVADSARRRKGKAVTTDRDLDVEKFREINELIETKAQFQHMIDYLCATLGISLPPPQQLCTENQVNSFPRQEPNRIDQHEVHRVNLGSPSQCKKHLETTRVKESIREAPQSHCSKGRSMTNNRVEASRSQAEGLVHGDLRYFLVPGVKGGIISNQPSYRN